MDLANAIPNGSWKTVDATVTGKFSSTVVKGTNVVKSGDQITSGDLEITHSNAWIPLIKISLRGYEPPPK